MNNLTVFHPEVASKAIPLLKELVLMTILPVLSLWQTIGPMIQTIVPMILGCATSFQFWVFFLLYVVTPYTLIVRFFRYQRSNKIKKAHGFTNDPNSYKNMKPDQAQAVLKNMAEWEFPFVFEFGWISKFFTTATAPCLSKVIVQSGHFTSTDVSLSHGRQQATVSLMTQMQVQPLHSREHALTMSRINEHHRLYSSKINSDTVLWLSWMWMIGPVQWINLIGWRKLQDFEVHAMFIYWREMSVMLGCKWVPNTLAELENFRHIFAAKEQYFSHWNMEFSDSMLDALLFSVPNFLKPIGRKCLVALFDEDVRVCNGYVDEYSPRLRTFLILVLKGWGLFQRYFCLPRMSPRILTATTNPNGSVNFPEYTYPATPYYVKKTLMNQYGPFAILNRLRGLPIPGPEFGSDGVLWETMGAKLANGDSQRRSEKTVLGKRSALMNNPWGYRTNINYQYKSIAVSEDMGVGYGDAKNAYQRDALVRL